MFVLSTLGGGYLGNDGRRPVYKYFMAITDRMEEQQTTVLAADPNSTSCHMTARLQFLVSSASEPVTTSGNILRDL